jgi:predicted nucleic acid-binding protein
VDLLTRLFREVLVPDIVARELADSEAPPALVKWASQFPSWISVQPTPLSPEPLEKLDPGEWAAILLAERQTSAVLLLIDDAAGRAEAERRHIPTTGTLGIIQAAAIRGFTELTSGLGPTPGDKFSLRGGTF